MLCCMQVVALSQSAAIFREHSVRESFGAMKAREVILRVKKQTVNTREWTVSDWSEVRHT